MEDPSGGKKKSRWILWLIGILLMPVVLLILYTCLALNWSFSKGERAGYIQKISQSGWICKTWEGEMAMVTMPGAIPDKFLFSVRDDKVAERINKFAGKRVALVYEQHKGLPTSCFGDTEYFIVDVKAIE
jgi:flagellar basal body-associated protein FliL